MNDVFGPAYAAAYDLFYARKDYEAECDVIERAFHEFAAGPVRRVLDLGCGTGGHAIPMARRGYAVVGVDRSPGMLAAAKAKAESLGMAGLITFLSGDVASPLDIEPCDAALMMFNVLGYQASHSEVAATFEAVSRALRPGGLFMFDVWQAEAIELDPPAPRRRLYEQGGEQWLRLSSGQLDPGADTCTVTIRVQRLVDGSVAGETIEHHRVRYFRRASLVELLEAAGMALVRVGRFPDYRREPDIHDWNVMAVARVVRAPNSTTHTPGVSRDATRVDTPGS